KATLAKMLFVRPASGAQVLFVGVLLMLLMATWMRAAVIVYALFFGVRPFPGLDHIAPMLFGTPTGWAMLVTGCVIGGLFPPFSFPFLSLSSLSSFLLFFFSLFFFSFPLLFSLSFSSFLPLFLSLLPLPFPCFLLPQPWLNVFLGVLL
ncbi:DUF2189 domain-containing protein, partial [Mesorhizobium sp. M1A.F.Ca.IN.020.32.1.1]